MFSVNTHTYILFSVDGSDGCKHSMRPDPTKSGLDARPVMLGPNFISIQARDAALIGMKKYI